MAKRPDMQVVGTNIAHLRREKGLCTAAFAREIEQPFWLIMLLESVHMEQAKRLSALLPDAVIEEVLREIHEVYGVSHRWLTTRHQAPTHPPVQVAAPLPEPLLLPVAITPEDALAILDDLMALALPDPRHLLLHDDFFRQSLKAVSMLYKLQQAQLAQNGSPALDDQQHGPFRCLLDQRVAHWREQFNLADLDLNESTSA